MEAMINGYLRSFFQALENLKQGDQFGVSHAIAYQEESLCVVLSLGDCRLKVSVEEFDPDPVKAAEIVVTQWKSMSRDEVNMAIQE
jgi:hypothetical protein